MAVGLSDPLVWNGATGPAKTAAYFAPPLGEPSCRLQEAATSLVTAYVLAGRGADPSQGAGRLFALSHESPELASSLALLSSWSLGAPFPPPGAVLRLPASTTDFFFLRERAILISLRMAGESCKVEIALIKASFPASAWCFGRNSSSQHRTLNSWPAGSRVSNYNRSSPNQPPLSLSLPSKSSKQPSNLFSHGSLNLTQLPVQHSKNQCFVWSCVKLLFITETKCVYCAVGNDCNVKSEECF